MALSIKNGEYEFLTRLDLMFFMPLCTKGVPIITNFKRILVLYRFICDIFEVLDFDY